MKKPVILCVDDEKIVLDSLVNQLRNHFGSRFVYETAENTEEGWEVIEELTEQEYEFKVIISDWLMPIERGDKFLIDISKKVPRAALIMLSGHADEESVERARQYANLQAFIRKPWDKEVLLSEVETALNRNRG
jgi:CheY-like chemotaxis protein